jgi:hypothetical protein
LCQLVQRTTTRKFSRELPRFGLQKKCISELAIDTHAGVAPLTVAAYKTRLSDQLKRFYHDVPDDGWAPVIWLSGTTRRFPQQQ